MNSPKRIETHNFMDVPLDTHNFIDVLKTRIMLHPLHFI